MQADSRSLPHEPQWQPGLAALGDAFVSKLPPVPVPDPIDPIRPGNGVTPCNQLPTWPKTLLITDLTVVEDPTRTFDPATGSDLGPVERGALDRRRSVTNEEALLWLKGIAESLLCRLHAGEPAFEPAEHPAFEPGWGISVALAGEKIGLLGLIRGTLRHAWRMNVPMAVGELKLEPLLAGFDKREPLKPVPAYPGVRRDLALLVPASLTHERIVEAIREAAPESLTDIRLFDIFMPKETRGERRSLAYTLEFRSAERTLTDDEVNAACQKIIKAVSETLGAEVRAG